MSWFDSYRQPHEDIPSMESIFHNMKSSSSNTSQSAIMTLMRILIFASIFVLVSLFVILIILYIRRQQTKHFLQNTCNLPTVMWLPKFLNYSSKNNTTFNNKNNKNNNNKNNVMLNEKYSNNNKYLRSSNITNILPRMSKLNGPYGMYGTVYGITTKVIHIAHPFPAKKVLQGVNKAQVTKRPAYNHFHNLFGDGVFTADGDDWKWQRKSVIHSLFSVSHNYKNRREEGDSPISPQFRLEKEANRAARQIMSEFTSFLILAEEKAKEKAQRHNNDFIDLMDYNISYHYEDEKKDDDHQETLTTNTATNNTKSTVQEDEINILPIIQKATNGIVSRFLTHDEDITSHHFNFNNNSTNHNNDNNNNNNNYNTFLQKYLEAITEIRMIILAQSRSFWFLLPRIFYILFSKMYRQEQYLMRNYIGRYAQFIVSKAKVNSPLHILIQQHENKKNNKNKNNKNSSSSLISKRVLDEAITLLFAGQDTSAATLSWTLHLLSLYPDCQEKLRQEILFFYNNDTQEEKEKEKDSNTTTSSSSSLPPQKKERHFSKKLTSKMPYLDAVLKESMRLYPVAPFVVRKLEEDIHIQPQHEATTTSTKETKATTLPKDSLACIWIYGLHRNPQLWKNPDEFDPDRWLVPPSNTSSTSSSSTRKRDLGIEQGAFMPFAVGPRNCLGQSIGTLVLKILLSSIISQYQVLHKEMMKEVEELDKQKDEEKNEKDNKKRKKIKELQHSLRKDMQAGFTILPSGGVNVVLKKFASSN